ncbi:hypothetical protein LWI29_030812 [Acer saccharum]|uniref:Uncharacterized protein n=1 Tax=Acer saccharum TaxID=4024 RepID=A0AA39SNV9_ACESA|nr:hypothetical protein LWI29_030812 [Acer saccharum]
MFAVTSIIDGLKKLYIQKLKPLEVTYRFNDFVSSLLLLEPITFVDTPGVLSGEKQWTQRAYDFTGETSWFAAKCDLILLLFDPHKLDVSDEFKRVISSLRGRDDKIRVVLNKADQVDTQQINELVKRARAAKIHAYIISHLKKEMPAMIGKAKTQLRLIDNLADEFGKVQREHHLPPGDFPNVEQFKEVLSGYNFDKFEKLKPKMIQSVDDMLGYGIPDLLKNFRNPYD